MLTKSYIGAANNAYTQGCVYTLHTMHRTRMYVHKIFKTNDTSHSSEKGGSVKGGRFQNYYYYKLVKTFHQKPKTKVSEGTEVSGGRREI